MKPVSLARLSVLLSASALIGGCAFAPGMRMITPGPASAQQGNSAETSTGASETESQVKIQDIDPALIRDLATRPPLRAETPATFDTTTSGYRLGPGDVLQITVWDHPEFAEAAGSQAGPAARPSDPPAGFVVDPNGGLQFPYVGQLHVAGLPPEQVQAALTKALGKMFRSPQVTVRVASFRARQVYIEGDVHGPGSLSVNDVPMTLYDAVSRAGGFLDSADQSRVVLVRDGAQHEFNLADNRTQTGSGGRIILKGGDLIHVPSREENGVYVMGEVVKPTTALPRRNGLLTLSDAISQAGSFNSATADTAQLYVVRGAQGATPEVYRLDARSPVAMVLANQFQLQPKDIVYVDGNGLVRFSRILNLLLPAINTGVGAAVLAK
ncbi:polysaccharide biosynthesis/export family protein [Paraburkholderia sp. J7]|uniref:polysaccharide biosynthesis/export family protein n=1 Tax=Paraburkholderia sp. J7 TaxID=2805438 RepID=UPI002AB7732F|nr:polysaccharide biosynthesis/export family protein [Paraburkholderia sp. J7]